MINNTNPSVASLRLHHACMLWLVVYHHIIESYQGHIGVRRELEMEIFPTGLSCHSHYDYLLVILNK